MTRLDARKVAKTKRMSEHHWALPRSTISGLILPTCVKAIPAKKRKPNKMLSKLNACAEWKWYKTVVLDFCVVNVCSTDVSPLQCVMHCHWSCCLLQRGYINRAVCERGKARCDNGWKDFRIDLVQFAVETTFWWLILFDRSPVYYQTIGNIIDFKFWHWHRILEGPGCLRCI